MTKTTDLHLAIIPDGNRRWAREHGFQAVWKGHEVAVENFRTLTNWCQEDPRVSVLTVWCFSTENWKRDQKEIDALMKMLEEYLRRDRQDFIEKKTRFVHSGRCDRIPASLKALIEETEELTKDQTAFTLHLAVDYGGKDEVLRAMNKLLTSRSSPADTRSISSPTPLTEEDLRSSLDHPELPDIDVILRSSGEKRTSNFFFFQAVYAEWIFNPKHFPEIGTTDVDAALQEYDRRKRRFGG